jgi:hypothetical protein
LCLRLENEVKKKTELPSSDQQDYIGAQ